MRAASQSASHSPAAGVKCRDRADPVTLPRFTIPPLEILGARRFSRTVREVENTVRATRSPKGAGLGEEGARSAARGSLSPPSTAAPRPPPEIRVLGGFLAEAWCVNVKTLARARARVSGSRTAGSVAVLCVSHEREPASVYLPTATCCAASPRAPSLLCVTLD